MSARHRKGFTLVELTIVVAVLGLLAAVAIPQLAEPSLEARSAAMESSLATLRTAVDAYWAQHDAFPGEDGSQQLIDQLCRTSTPTGEVGRGARYSLGPYLTEDALPENPFAGSNTVRVVRRMPGRPQGNAAWLYDSSTGEVRCNRNGLAANGVDMLFEL